MAFIHYIYNISSVTFTFNHMAVPFNGKIDREVTKKECMRACWIPSHVHPWDRQVMWTNKMLRLWQSRLCVLIPPSCRHCFQRKDLGLAWWRISLTFTPLHHPIFKGKDLWLTGTKNSLPMKLLSSKSGLWLPQTSTYYIVSIPFLYDSTIPFVSDSKDRVLTLGWEMRYGRNQ